MPSINQPTFASLYPAHPVLSHQPPHRLCRHSPLHLPSLSSAVAICAVAWHLLGEPVNVNQSPSFLMITVMVEHLPTHKTVSQETHDQWTSANFIERRFLEVWMLGSVLFVTVSSACRGRGQPESHLPLLAWTPQHAICALGILGQLTSFCRPKRDKGQSKLE